MSRDENKSRQPNDVCVTTSYLSGFFYFFYLENDAPYGTPIIGVGNLSSNMDDYSIYSLGVRRGENM